MTSPLTTLPPLAVRGRAFKALALTPEAPLPDWLARLDAALTRSPSLFEGRAVVLDLASFTVDAEALAALVAQLAGRRIRILGIEGAGAADGVDGLPPFLAGGRPDTRFRSPILDAPEIGIPETKISETKIPEAPAPTSLTIEGSVRSGRSIVHREGDVTVMGSVSSGAEILAGGSIHVYGALRGRAIAGAASNPRARIYCRKFEPELLGIDRHVRTAEEFGPALRGKPAQIWLDGGALKLAQLD